MSALSTIAQLWGSNVDLLISLWPLVVFIVSAVSLVAIGIHLTNVLTGMPYIGNYEKNADHFVSEPESREGAFAVAKPRSQFRFVLSTALFFLFGAINVGLFFLTDYSPVFESTCLGFVAGSTFLTYGFSTEIYDGMKAIPGGALEAARDVVGSARDTPPIYRKDTEDEIKNSNENAGIRRVEKPCGCRTAAGTEESAFVPSWLVDESKRWVRFDLGAAFVDYPFDEETRKCVKCGDEYTVYYPMTVSEDVDVTNTDEWTYLDYEEWTEPTGDDADPHLSGWKQGELPTREIAANDSLIDGQKLEVIPNDLSNIEKADALASRSYSIAGHTTNERVVGEGYNPPRLYASPRAVENDTIKLRFAGGDSVETSGKTTSNAETETKLDI